MTRSLRQCLRVSFICVVYCMCGVIRLFNPGDCQWQPPQVEQCPLHFLAGLPVADHTEPE